MPEPPDDVLTRYAARILALKDERDRGVDDAMLCSIAEDLGMTDADLAAARAAGEAHRARGAGYVEHGRIDDAIAELEHACALAPLDLASLHALADARRARFVAERAPADAERARALARRCLAIDPAHGASFQLLNALDAKATEVARERATKTWRAAVGAIAAIGVVTAGVALLRARDSGVRRSAPAQIAASPAGGPAAGATGDVEIPVSIVAAERFTGVTLEVRKSSLARYPGSAFYTLHGILHSTRPMEIQHVAWQIDSLDAAGTVVQSDRFDGPASHEAALRPGDEHVIALLLRVRPDVVEARLSAVTVEEDPAASSYPPSPPVELIWVAQRPPGVAVVARQRALALSPAAFGLGPFYKATYEVENAGAAPLRQLKLELQFLDAAGVVQGKAEHFVTFSGKPSMRSHEVRLARFTSAVGPTFARAALAVTEVE